MEEEIMNKTSLLKSICWVLVTVFCVGIFAQSVDALTMGQLRATKYWFRGYAKPNYTTVSRALCVESGGVSSITLTEVGVPSAKYIINVEDDNRRSMGDGHLWGTGTVPISTNTKTNTYYNLRIGREYFYDPPTLVIGHWSP